MQAGRAYLLLALTLTLFATAVPRAHGDGGQVQYSGLAGPYRVTVFTQPVPLRAGPADFSVLVQNPDTGNAVLDGSVRIDLSRPAAPGEMTSATPSRAAATNKLLRAAIIRLPAAGKYRVSVTVTAPPGTAHAEFEVDVAPALPPWRSLLPWIIWPAVPIGLYVWQVVVARRAQTRRTPPAAAGG